MAEHGVPIRRVINAGGVPHKNAVLNQVYANVLGKPVLVPERPITSLGSAIFAFLAAGVFASIDAAQRALCPTYHAFEPDAREQATCERLYSIYKSLYFAMGDPHSDPVHLGTVLPELRRIAFEVRGRAAST